MGFPLFWDALGVRPSTNRAGGTRGVRTAFEDDGGWLAPSPKLATMRRAEGIGAGAAVLVVACLAAGFGAGAVAAAIAAAATLVASGLADSFLRRRARSWAYLERGEDLIVRRGVAFHRLTVVPYGRMQLVDVTAGPVERAFGLATVRLHTAASATDARVPGLADAEARRLRDRLSDLGEAQAEGL